MSFLTGSFLFALVAAGGPVLIHLLNKRRHRTVEWAAMEFLREAVRRNKRVMELRDMLLLAMRTLAVILFVLAMAQPYWASGDNDAWSGEPVHAILVIDNSLSMGYTQLDKTLLDVAKEKADEFIGTLPKGSDVSVIPLCDRGRFDPQDVYQTREGAIEAVDAIELVDRDARAGYGAELAAAAAKRGSANPTKRVVFIGDMQERTWASTDLKRYFEELGNVQVVQVSPEKRSNTWVSEFRLQDGVADDQTSAVFLATVSHTGDEERSRLRVTLKIDDLVAEERFVDLQPGQDLQLMFKHRFDVAGTSKEPLFVPATLEVSADHLPQDDYRTIIVPVVAKVPVLFVDQFGESERPRLNRYGETFPLRRLLAPRTSHDPDQKSLVDIRHRIASEVTQDDLKDVRLAVLAGVEAPTPDLVRALREYVEQGGQLFIAAGAEFDPLAWNATAWLDGNGILPAPLKSEALGNVPPPSASQWPSFHLASNTFKDEVFAMQMTDNERSDLLSSPFFYKAVAVDRDGMDKFAEAARKRVEDQRKAFEEHEANERRWAELERAGKLSQEEAAKRKAAREKLGEGTARWLEWSNPLAADDEQLTIEQRIAQTQPRVMGEYDNGAIFAVRRSIGKGKVIMVTTGTFPVWNNVAVDASGSVLLFDRMLRTMLTMSLPSRTLDPINQVQIPLRADDQAARFVIQTPGDPEPHPLQVDALEQGQYALTLRDVGKRGVYRVWRESATGGSPADDKANHEWLKLAINGPSAESKLTSIDAREFAERVEVDGIRWVNADEEISLAGTTYIGHNVWWWLMLMVILLLLGEMVFLALPHIQRELEARAAGKSNPSGTGDDKSSDTKGVAA
ncbi:MAG: VWA domain-containing protein [Phycisphaera sp.]|nr:VWA domain-containing protein [Phycisphaera sp.]